MPVFVAASVRAILLLALVTGLSVGTPMIEAYVVVALPLIVRVLNVLPFVFVIPFAVVLAFVEREPT